MYKKQLLTLVIILMGVQSSFGQKKEYYRHLIFRETPYSDTRGNHPIDEKTAMKEAHYRFVYDNQNRLVEVSHRLGNDIIADNGNWDSFIWFSPKMTIEYSGNQEIRHFYNQFDEKIEAHGKMYKAVFKLNAEGKRTDLHFYDKEGNPSESSWGIHKYEWTYLEDGNIIEKRFNKKGESRPVRPNFTFHTIRLEFGEDDLLDFMVHLDENGKLINNTMSAAMDRIVYDQEENFSRWMVFDNELNPVEGNAPQLAIGEHLYDCRGNKVELRGFDVTGKNKAMPNGVARQLNTYDTFNNQIEIKTFDLEGNQLQHIKREYSIDGKRVEWIKCYDTNGNLTMHPSGQFAAIKFEYEKDGRTIKQKFYNENLQEIG